MTSRRMPHLLRTLCKLGGTGQGGKGGQTWGRSEEDRKRLQAYRPRRSVHDPFIWQQQQKECRCRQRQSTCTHTRARAHIHAPVLQLLHRSGAGLQLNLKGGSTGAGLLQRRLGLAAPPAAPRLCLLQLGLQALCARVHVHVCLCKRACVCACVHVNAHVHVCLCKRACVCACLGVSVSARPLHPGADLHTWSGVPALSACQGAHRVRRAPGPSAPSAAP